MHIYEYEYEGFAIEREEIPKKNNFIFICQKCFKCYNLFRFYINSFFIFFGVSFLSIAKLPYYEKIFDDNDDCINIKCNYCDQKYSSKSSTTTLNDYWKRKHLKVQPGGVGLIEAVFNNNKSTHEKEYSEN